jgi:hypothetical protein
MYIQCISVESILSLQLAWTMQSRTQQYLREALVKGLRAPG